jgi:eukaryotic-like serine/threonine-protein kinase
MNTNDEEIFKFGPFLLDPGQRMLMRDGKPVPLQPKAFDTLVVLVRNRGKLVLKNDLLETVWGHTVVEESNVSQNIFVLRKALSDGEEGHRYIVTVPGRGYRFEEPAVAAAVTPVPSQQSAVAAPSEAAPKTIFAMRPPWLGWALALGAVALAAIAYVYVRPAPKLGEKDTIVVADFVNTTGDAVFDGTLRQGLVVDLGQSPFLNLLSDQQIAQTLLLMAQPKNSKVSGELALEVCQRTASAAVLNGSIAAVGTEYLLTLQAVSCKNSQSFASVDARAMDKNHVLDSLSSLGSRIRTKLGESLASVKKFDTPLESVTTSSLEALQSYTLGSLAMSEKRDTDAVGLFERAISLDASFAMAYMRLGTLYFNLDESGRAMQYMENAYAFRDRATEREKLHIAANYAAIVTQDLEVSRKTYETSLQIYPRDASAVANLATIYGFLADYDKGLQKSEEALLLAPDTALAYSNLIISLLQVNRLDDALAAAKTARERHIDSPFIHANLYLIDFLKHDESGMELEAKAIRATDGWADLVLYNESDTAAFAGRFSLARDLTQRAADSAQKSDRKETAAAYMAEAALREAIVGNTAIARQQAHRALEITDAREVAAMAAMALAASGEPALAGRLADELQQRFPQDTIVNFNYLPTIRAIIALSSANAGAAIDALAIAKRYETGQTTQLVTFAMYPVYFRGQAMLMSKVGSAAAAEFQALIDHPGIVQNEIVGALAQLGLGRSYALAGDSVKAAAAYQEFLSLWKSADPDLPLLGQAKTEFAKLQMR